MTSLSSYQNKEMISEIIDRPLDKLVQLFYLNQLDEVRMTNQPDEIHMNAFIFHEDISPFRPLPPIKDSWFYFSTFLCNNKEKLYQKICFDFKYCEKRSESHRNDQICLVAGIADAISTLTIGIPTILFVTILFKLGLDAFCGCNSRFRCEGTTIKGHPCKRLVSHNGEFCWQHANLNRSAIKST